MILTLMLYTIIVILYANEADCCDEYSFLGDAHFDDRDDSDVETNKTVHVVDWPGRLTRKMQNYTQLTVQWNQPLDNSHLCVFNLHYYKASDVDNAMQHFTVNIPPNTTEFTIKELTMGTSYHAYVEAIFDVPVSIDGRKVLRSWILITKTLACNCVKQATNGNCVDCCDQLTGKCSCKDEFTFGQRCELCAPLFYMDPEVGCVACDQCPSDGVMGDGSCKPAFNIGMQCNCGYGYTGKHCQSCDVGFYSHFGFCNPCNCSGNQKTTMKDICDVKGDCLACDYHTTGEHCELCYPGYVGNAFLRTCRMPSKLGENLGIALIVVAVFCIVIILSVAFLCRRRRRLLITGTKTCHSSLVNFTSLMEEPENDRKLQLI